MINRIVFPKTFESDSFGARRAHVEDAIRHADGVVELPPANERKPSEPYLTLHSKLMTRPGTTKFVWVIGGRVEAGIHSVLNAFQATAETVPVVNASDALACLRSFAAVYGIDADWGAGSRERFVEHAIVNASPQAIMKNVADHLIAEDRPRKFLLVCRIKQLGPQQSELRWTFALNVSAYENMLRQLRAN